MINYKPLWKLLIDRGMTKAELRRRIGISPNTMTRLRRNEEVSLKVLCKIAEELNVTSFDSIIEFEPDKK